MPYEKAIVGHGLACHFLKLRVPTECSSPRAGPPKGRRDDNWMVGESGRGGIFLVGRRFLSAIRHCRREGAENLATDAGAQPAPVGCFTFSAASRRGLNFVGHAEACPTRGQVN